METQREKFSSSFVYGMTCGVTLGGLCYGYNLAVISGAMLYIQPFFRLNNTWQGVIVGSSIISASVSALVAGPMIDKLGRRASLFLMALVTTVGSVVGAAAPSKEVLFVGRMCTGLSFPFLSTFCPVYIAEMVPTSIRGRMLTSHQLLIAVSFMFSALAAGAFSYLESNQWRYMLGFAILPAVAFGVAIFFLPESPRWLLAKGRHQEATHVLQRIYGYDDVSQKVKEIQEATSSQKPTNICGTLRRIVTTPHVLKALAVGSCLALIFVWSGCNIVLFFSGTIMKMVGFPVEYAVWIQGVAPLAIFLGIFPSIYAVDKHGRRPIVLISIAGSTVSMILASVGFHFTTSRVPEILPFNVTDVVSNVTHLSKCLAFTGCEACVQDLDCGLCYRDTSGFCLPALDERYSTLGPCSMNTQSDHAFQFANDYCPSVYAWIVVAGFFFFCLFFAPGLPSLAWTITSEIYPMWALGMCNTLVVSVFWVSNTIFTFAFLPMVETLGSYGTFWLLTAVCALGFVLFALFLPETKNRSLEETEEIFMTSKQLQRYREERENNLEKGTEMEKY